MRPYLVLFCLVWIVTAGMSQDFSATEKWLQEAEAAYESVTNYTAIFHKQQQVEGKLLRNDAIFIKFRKPFSLYMRWINGPYKGCELLYVEGWNENRARVHKGGFWGFITWDLEPTSSRLMDDNLRPLTDAGLGMLVQTVATNVCKASKAGEINVYERGAETVHGLETRRIEVVFPKDKDKGYAAYRFVINQELTSKLLVRIQTYDWDDHLLENYAYEDLKLNTGLTDADFDSENPQYHF